MFVKPYATGRTVIVAGSVGPTGEIFEPMGSLTHALAVFHHDPAPDGGEEQDKVEQAADRFVIHGTRGAEVQ